MQITLTLPESLTQTDTFNQSDWLREIAIALCQQTNLTLAQAAQLAQISPSELQQLLTNRAISATTESDAIDPDNEPEELILESLHRSLQQVRDGKVHPISELWDGIDV
ncbi:UPF0175 family protein [Microcoleus sp. bin38.metabat.b11b12b14.051]|uniref:UPF0175 family protein n=1 Tax=Microcoleus sp. bin38.metabat.b11b12b14.051 TaxID=2742709 RepID=UPI0025ECAF8C|nr:UPF0175 family protein [Microcoleus sp. bin38.metabat.b11b12b14.051]